MSTSPQPHPNVTVRGPRRQVVRRVVVTRNLRWLNIEEIERMNMRINQVYDILSMNGFRGPSMGQYNNLPVRIELVPTLCDDIRGGDCCVCMESMESHQMRRFGCSHETCVTCFEQIYNTTAKCPLCRAAIKEVSKAPEKRTIRVPK